ncbi:hypothetical protein EXIGLDRAFT_831119 [Exidia glandulosa HHB12029]|uniref:C3H1-type domain-containing protein n=1 Tax=Exidia glandulosa HHB12029 TaxID=1314781 RepID=A0A165N0X1_EXIGL|nr:hypothetical protein EXIGLDRAFT_831119 [Exidia glandulosa HHB12029]
MSADAALLREIEQLSAAINNRKNKPAQPFVHPRPAYYQPAKPFVPRTREIVINGSAYQTSSRKLTRKPAPGAATASEAPSATVANAAAVKSRYPPTYSRTHAGYMVKSNRVHKPVPHFTATRHRNRVLNNVASGSRAARKERPKKQCRNFSVTGVCKSGRTCRYDHDPNKVAICPRFLQRECPLDATTCPLSHDPTPERVPLCVHFLNNGRCKNGSTCLYPHVNVGKREGVCRDFAVLGYCAKGLECDKQHIHECPDFAETGRCANRQCKLPHVIRANRTRAVPPGPDPGSSSGNNGAPVSGLSGVFVDTEPAHIVRTASGEEEFIPLTFHESSDDEEDDDDSGDDDDDDVDEDGSDGGGAGSPTAAPES